MGGGQVCFTAEDLELFRQASHDHNPLHESASFTRRTPFGEPVVFGMLTVLAGLGRLDAPPQRMLGELAAAFPNPAFPGLDYRVEIDRHEPERSSLSLLDGRRAVCRLKLRWQPLALGGPGPPAEETAASTTAAVHTREAMRVGLAAEGSWGAGAEALAALRKRFELPRELPEGQLAAILWASYLVGMELPGRDALFTRLTLRFPTQAAPRPTPLRYRAVLAAFDPRFDLCRIDARLEQADRVAVEGEIEAFLRQDSLREEEAERFWSRRPAARKADSRSAVVVGASRGLGASLAYGLAREGWTVYATYRESSEDARALQRRAAETAGSVVALQGDAADLDWWLQVRERIRDERPSLDLLVCSACPALHTLWIEPESVERVNRYVHDSVALVTAPLAAFLEDLAQSSGQVVIVSSQAVCDPVAEWPHYVAAKGAVEALASAAASEQRKLGFLVVRPPRLLTQLADAPLARATALAPEAVTVAVLERLGEGSDPGSVQIIDSFPGK
jgi:NAD(P)-dependent dehydrogenase (short-subunit alcohol dehydrogenase family)